MMQENNTTLDHLDLVYEMNRLFLSFLQGRAKRDIDCLGLPAAISALLRSADDEQLNRAAALPHALFRLDLAPSSTADAPLERSSSEAIALYCLQVSLLQSVRNLCRQNAHLAQAFLSLPATSLVRLRCLVLIELTGLAESSRLVRAGFADKPWLWREMLSADAALDQRRLRLIAMQPRTADMLLQPRRAGIRIQ